MTHPIDHHETLQKPMNPESSYKSENKCPRFFSIPRRSEITPGPPESLNKVKTKIFEVSKKILKITVAEFIIKALYAKVVVARL